MKDEDNGEASAGGSASLSSAKWEQNAIYQAGRLVGRVVNAKVDSDAREVRFEEIYNSDELLLPDDCEYQNYRILIHTIGFATKIDKSALHKGRVLREVRAEILGYREQ